MEFANAHCPVCGFPTFKGSRSFSYCGNETCGEFWDTSVDFVAARIARSLAGTLARPFDKDWIMDDNGLRQELEALVTAVKKGVLSDVIECASLAAEGRKATGKNDEALGIEAMILWLEGQREMLD